MKTLILFLSLFLFAPFFLAQDEEGSAEIYFTNSSSTTVYVRIYPVSMLFNNLNFYDLHTSAPDNQPPYVWHYNTSLGFDGKRFYEWEIEPTHNTGYQHENSAEPQLNGVLGHGVYKIEFFWNDQLKDTCLVEYDAWSSSVNDLIFTFQDDEINGQPVISYHWDHSGCSDRTITAAVRYLRSWEIDWCHYPPINNRPKDRGNYIYKQDPNNQYSMLPQDYRQDCGTEESYREPEIYDQYGTGRLTLNLTIDKAVTTRIGEDDHFSGVRFDVPTQIVITPGCTLKINGGKSLTVKKDNQYGPGKYDWYTKLIVMPSGWLRLNDGNALLAVEMTNWLVLYNQSNLYIGSGSVVDLRPHSTFCDYGAHITGPGKFRIVGVLIPCSIGDNYETIFSDSVNLQLSDTAMLQIPDSTTWTFQGIETALLCDSGSTIKFGKGSKLVFTDGARINAKHTIFTTYDSNTTWNGIYLNGVSYDTLQNCTFENALNGINIEDKISYFGNAPATEISNCAFSNKTSEQLLNMVYVNNSANVMIHNCTSSSLINDGFASGVIIEYCTAGGVNVIDNEIGYVTTGINIIQSSPYIARNTITGSGTSGTGIYLDNSNGTIEFNIVGNFEKSTVLYYSSPYMLKNTFSDANTACADVTAYSVPVMKPIASGSTLRWLGGNNYFTGQPSTAGITLESEGHPLMDSGYNVINVGNSLYMQGTISRVLYMRVNNWFDDPPENGKFDISGESIDYSEYFDGQSLPPTDYYELNEIGFGYYDTVYVDELEGDNMTAEDVFILAYKKEMERKFVEALILYKNVITNFNTSNYAITSLSRIFNCLEKSNAGINQYSAVKSYYDGIKNSNTYPQRIREHAEDLAIKAKVRMGFIEEAISDYQTIINNNGNNPKGIHAQVNKLVLMNMNNGGDNLLFGNKQNNENYKANLISLITVKNIQAENRFANNIPRQFKLHQNYPNPFNPKTVIKYDIPVGTRHGVFVQLTIYDITGREIVNLSEFKQAGSYSYTFDGKNYASGLYIYRIVTPDFTESKKMLLVK